jgi:hypothetical protein
MPTPTPDEFWILLSRSRLLDAGVAAALRREHAAAGAAVDAKAAAQWLVDRGVLTRWQAKRIAIGDLGPFFLGDYRLLERHERQGDGLLFTARHDPSGRRLNLMLLNTKLCRELDIWTEIVRRTTAAHQAADPMLSRTWALEQVEGSRFIVCEEVNGETLADELARLGPLPPAQAGVLAVQIARAVAELHAVGAVHAGLSLDSLIREPVPAESQGRNGRVRLLQFPLVYDPHTVPLRPLVGNDEAMARLGRRASFVAPELLLPDQPCDARSDVYALGCILHALLTGLPPCWQGDPQSTLRQAAFAGPAPLGPPVPPEVAALVAYLTARDPESRYPTAGDAADAIAICCGIAPRSSQSPATGGVASARSAHGGVDHAFPRLTAPAADGRAARPGPMASPVGGLAIETSVSSATLAARRRARRLRMIGMAAASAVLMTAAAVVITRIDFGAKVPIAGGTASRRSDTLRPPRSPVVADRDTAAVVAPAATTSEDPQPAVPAIGQPVPPAVAAERQVVVDDPSLPWASPTSGLPPTLAYLPPGAQLILVARPAAAAADPEGGLFVQSLGPDVETATSALAAICGCGLADIEMVQAGWQAGGVDEVLAGYAVRLVAGRLVPADDSARRAAWGETTQVELDGQTIHRGSRFSFWVPPAGEGRTLVFAPDELLRKIVAAGPDAAASEGLAASLPKDLETLVGMLDRDRHVTVVGSPHYLLHDGRGMLAGPMAKLIEPLEMFFGDTIKAAALSLHFGDRFYAELDAVATADAPAVKIAPAIAQAVSGLPDTVERYCFALNPDPYGRALVLRLPQMIRAVSANLRSAAEGKGIVLNAYLPRHAAHNLALAAELALAQSPGAVAARPAAGGAAAPQDGQGGLRKKMTLTFAKDTLEKSIQMIAEEIGVPMEIIGPDLQLEGITKNQSFGLDERDKTAEEILRVILAKANPDGKLVYVVRKQEAGEAVEITTRAAAAKRGDTLPKVFEEAGGSSVKQR